MGNEKMMVLMMMMICCGIGGISAAVYKVGESSGWAMGANYDSWATDKTFKVGDTLVFNYGSGHTVDEVSANDYKSCTTGNSISSDSTGATSITLKTAGPHYFICGIPGHCDGGMKLAITAAAAAPTDGGSSKASPTAGTISPPSTTTTASPLPPTVETSPTAGTATEKPSSAAAVTPATAACFAFSIAVLKYFVV